MAIRINATDLANMTPEERLAPEQSWHASTRRGWSARFVADRNGNPPCKIPQSA